MNEFFDKIKRDFPNRIQKPPKFYILLPLMTNVEEKEQRKK